jgi:hypothetical protein
MQSIAKTTYTEAHRKCYLKHHEKNLIRMKSYYQLNKDKLKENRRRRYAEIKLASKDKEE